MDWITNNSMRLMQKNLDFTWQKQRVISENIANAETPGYKSKYITFEDELQQKLSSASDKSGRARYDSVRDAIDSSRFVLHRTNTETTRLDGNNVNTDVENAELARTQLQYEFLTRQISDQFSRLRIVIEGR